jgi:7-carboxy-7-deazaguanine synthase
VRVRAAGGVRSAVRVVRHALRVHGGTKKTVDDVVREVEGFGARVVEITGGEPMLQREVTVLMQKLLDAGHEVLLETGGHIPLDDVPRRWSRLSM